jgi:hypothetical protein
VSNSVSAAGKCEQLVSLAASCLRRRRLRRRQAEGALEGLGNWTIEIVKRSDAAKSFIRLPRRWVVERTVAWLNRNRRLVKDVDATIESSVTWLYIASVKLMSRRLAAV